MSSISNLKKRLKYLQAQIGRLERILDSAPPGTLYIRSQAGGYQYTKYIHLPDGSAKEVYLGKNAPELRPLAEKRYAQVALDDLLAEKKYVEQQLHYLERKLRVPAFLETHPGIQQLLSQQIHPLTEHAKRWIAQEYEKNDKHPENLKYPTVVSGLTVRSKAEADLVAQFHYYGIPFRYEEVIEIDGQKLAIDFTLLNVRSTAIFYWDHRGLSDDPKYLQKTHYCEAQYQKANIIPWVNLIVTTETQDHPLDLHWVNQLIEYYLI